MISRGGPGPSLFCLNALAENGAARHELAARAIEAQGVNDVTSEEIGELADQVCHQLRELLKRLESDERLFTVMEKNGFLRFDFIALAFLEQIGPSGKHAANELRPEACAAWQAWLTSPQADESKLWKLWLADGGAPPLFSMILARVVWLDVLRREHPQTPAMVEPPPKTTATSESKPSHMYPVVSAVVVRRVMEAFFIGNPKVKKVANETRLVSQRGEDVAVVSPDAADDVTRVAELASGTRSLLGHRFFRCVVSAGVNARLLSEGHDYRVLQVVGGLSGLAAQLGMSGSKAATELRGILDAFRHIWVRLPHGRTDSLLTWTLDHAKPGEKALLRIALHDALLPGYVNGLPKNTPAQREARKLVPVPRLLPPLIGHCRSHASQALLQLLIIEEFASRAEELFQNGLVRIPWSRWQAFGKEAGLSSEKLEAVFLAWAHGPMSFLRREPESGDTFTLSKDFGAELQVMMKGGERSAMGRARQARLAKFKQ